MRKINVSLVLACYNEGPTLSLSLSKIIDTLKSIKYSWEIVAIDDSSRDSTYKTLKKFSKKIRNFYLYKNEINIGRGGTVVKGIKKARGEIVGFVDVDLEISSVYILEFVKAIEEGADIAIATRIYKEGLSSLNRWILSKGYTLLTKNFLDIDVKDTEAGYKFFRRKKILPILEITKDNKWFFDTEIIAVSLKEKLRIKEIPVLFLRRHEKKSTVRIIPDIIAYLKAIYEFKKQ